MTQPRILRIDPDNPDVAIIKEAAGILEKNGVIVAPTETRYGLLVRSDDMSAVMNLYSVKGRPASQPTAIFLRSAEEIDKFAYVSEVSRRLADCFLPGPLTLVLKARPGFSPPIAVEGKIGFRISPAPLIAALLEMKSFNLTATSANISGQKEPESISEIAATFGHRVALYLDGGKLSGPVSTVIDCSGDDYEIIRHGAIPGNRIKECLGG
ncbi:putative threonylcarbamoyl-AMP synthase [Candidatus Zixiibacteriota bacterium]|nr:putative threonylcarbamoyl-AMP synthase [candidate division Zixibacteria bacterium]